MNYMYAPNYKIIFDWIAIETFIYIKTKRGFTKTKIGIEVYDCSLALHENWKFQIPILPFFPQPQTKTALQN